ncbi:MAG: Gfo/Idh/MocA family oxidoreductase [Dehalococcoidia bacterium]
MPSPLKAAVIGLGSMGANHARVLGDMPGIELIAVADADPERVTRTIAGRSTRGFADASSLLSALQPDLVSVVVPTQLHEAVGLAVLEAGCNMLMEKPIAATPAQGAALAEAAARRGLILTVGHIERFNPAVRELKRRLDAGQGGRIIQLRARRVGPFPHRIRDVGVIHDLGPHDIDIMRYLLDDDVERVYASAARHIKTENEDIFAGMLHFRGGVTGILEINWLTPTKERTLTVLCEKGMFIADYANQSLAFFENASARAREGTFASVTEGEMARYSIESREPLRAELEAFRDAVASGGPAPVPARDGLAAVVIADALVASSQSGMPVAVPAVELGS